ncbi:MAG TPA: hypothetical protein VFW11_04990, partial [Cyclobacteriaceae bacterium]|nr:hypothetical protein [Cyclobacteriaceae bacterium]
MDTEATIQLNNTESLEAKVRFLSLPETYGDTEKVEVLETHMSWVFLTDKYVYKLKKPVHYDFLDFRSIESRQQCCLEEVRINKPLAGDTYLKVVPLVSSRHALRLAGSGEVIDWLVKMKRLPREHMLDSMILKKTIRFDWVQRAAEVLADFYLACPAADIGERDFKNQIIQDINKNSKGLLRKEFKLNSASIIGITASLLHFLVENNDLFCSRVHEGRVIDGHGDLRPEHICLAPGPAVIDRIEFDKSLRVIDVAEELSFLSVEC